MAQAEARISRAIMTDLRGLGHFCFKVHGSEHMMAGLPDIIVCAEGHFIGLETKRPTERFHTSPRQDYVHGLISESGGHAFVVTSVQEAREAVESVLNG
jgi:hypothetical protein